MAIAPFGWHDTTAPALDAANLEAMHAAAGAYTDAQVATSLRVTCSPSGDTTGATDTAAIQSAINGSAAGATIIFGTGTYYVNAAIQYLGDRQYIGLGHSYAYGGAATIKQANGANITATGGISGLFVAAGWVANNTACDDPVLIENINFDGNSSNNPTSTACGIVMMNYAGHIKHCYTSNTPRHGILLTDTGANGTTLITNTAVNNRILECKIDTAGGHGIAVVCNSNIANTDGYLEDCIVASVAGDGINIQRAAGWLIRHNHIEPLGTNGLKICNGIVCVNGFATTIVENYVESFGDANVSGTYYAGIWVQQGTGRGTVVANNQVYCAEANVNTSHFQYLHISALPSASNAWVNVLGNVIQGPSSFTSNGIGIVLDQDGSGGDLFGVVEGNSVSSVQTSGYIAGSFVQMVIKDNPGWNPFGLQTVSVPASGTAVAAVQYDRTFYVKAGTSTCTMAIQNGPAPVIPASSLVTVRVPAGITVTPTYTNAPTWLVEGD